MSESPNGNASLEQQKQAESNKQHSGQQAERVDKRLSGPNRPSV